MEKLEFGQSSGIFSDGAAWIKNWTEDTFPKTVSILDYYHVCEHLHEFSSSISYLGKIYLIISNPIKSF